MCTNGGGNEDNIKLTVAWVTAAAVSHGWMTV